MSLYKRGRIYWFHFESGGEHYQESTHVTNRAAAARIEAAKRLEVAELRAGIHRPAPTPLLEDYAPKFLAWSKANHRRETTRLHKNNLRVLTEFFRGRKLEEITPAAIEDFKIARLSDRRRGNKWRTPENQRKAVSIVSANRAVTTLKLIFRLAQGEFSDLKNPAAGVSRYKETGAMRVITRDEESRYFAAMRSAQLRDVARVMLEVGPRPQEVMGLRLADVDVSVRTLRVANQERNTKVAVLGKTENAPRSLPLTLRAADVLAKRVAGLRSQSRESFLFPSKAKCGHIRSVRKQHDRAVARAEIQPAFRLYDLRHTFATRQAEKGTPLPVLAALLGHSDIRMTMRYVHPQQAAMRAAIENNEAAAS
jgi:integrase